MWKFFGKRFGRSSGASVSKTPSGSLADLRGKFYLDKVSWTYKLRYSDSLLRSCELFGSLFVAGGRVGRKVRVLETAPSRDYCL